MTLPFTISQFLDVFKNYNLAVFPAQVVFYLLGGVAIFLVIRPTAKSDSIVSLILSVFWLWMGIVYHIIFFSTINKVAYLVGVVFLLQGILFLVHGVFQKKISFQYQCSLNGNIGLSLILFSMFLYPLIGYLLGDVYPSAPTFGLPCPTTIFTLGFLVINTKKTRTAIIIIPLLWSVIGFMAVIQLGVMGDISLLIAGLITLSLIIYKNVHVQQV